MPPVAPDLAQLAAALRATFPGLGPVTPRDVLGAGFRSVAIETAEGWVFRVARNREAAEGHAREARLLPRLRGRVPVTVPDPRWRAGPSDTFPFGVIGYAKLPGRPLAPELVAHAEAPALARDIARFLLALHRFPLAEAEALGLPGPDARRAELATLRDTVLPPLRAALTVAEYGVLRRWWEGFLEDERVWRYPPVLQHGDLWYENILVAGRPRAVAGVVDFENAAIGDPAQDFATQFHLGAAFAGLVIAAYRALGAALDPGFDYRLQKLWELREFDGVGHAVRYDDADELADAIRKLRRGPVLDRDAGRS